MPVEGVKQIKILLNTSAPNSKQEVFTSDMLSVEGSKKKLEKYPFILTNARYSDALRYKLRMMEYKDVVEFFFNRTTFEKYVSGDIKTTQKTKRKKGGKRRKTKRRNQNISHFYGGNSICKYDTKESASQREMMRENYVLMLELLFPTSFPIPNNLNTSMYGLTHQSKDKLIRHLSFKNTFPGMNNKISVITMNGKKYTIMGVYWINDILNYPVYRNILNSYVSFDKWMNDKGKTIKDDFVKDQKKFVKEYLTSFIIEHANQELKTNRTMPIDSINFWKPVIVPGSQRAQVIVSSSSEENREYIETYNAEILHLNEKYKLKYSPTGEIIFEEEILNNPDQEINEIFVDDILLKLDLALKSFEKIQRPNLGEKVVNTYKKIIKRFKELQEKNVIFEYVYNKNFDYLKDEPTEVVNRINKEFPKFEAVSKSIMELKNRIIENEIWKRISKSIIQGEKSSSNNNDVSPTTLFKALLEKITKCYDILNTGIEEEKGCIKSNIVTKIEEKGKKIDVQVDRNCVEYFFSVGFDTIKDQDPNSSGNVELIESCLLLNLIEGDITKEKPGCDFKDNLLGERFMNLIQFKTSDWDVESNKYFYDNTQKKSDKAPSPSAPPLPPAPPAPAPAPPPPPEK